jgi:hypothetical protein
LSYEIGEDFCTLKFEAEAIRSIKTGKLIQHVVNTTAATITSILNT